MMLYYTVGRDLYNVHAVDITELFFLGEGCTCHTAFFVIFVEKVLEGNGCESLALSFNLHMLFRLDRLTVGVVLNDMKPEERRAAYGCDIKYVTNNELGFDYLRDNMVI